MTRRRGVTTTIYEGDAEFVGGGDPRIHYVPAGDFKRSTYKFKPNPGRRPRRKPGESPLDPPSE